MKWDAIRQLHLCGPNNTVLDKGSSPPQEGEIRVLEPKSKFALQIAVKPLHIAEWLV